MSTEAVVKDLAQKVAFLSDAPFTINTDGPDLGLSLPAGGSEPAVMDDMPVSKAILAMFGIAIREEGGELILVYPKSTPTRKMNGALALSEIEQYCIHNGIVRKVDR